MKYIALYPDIFAHYRYPVFKELSNSGDKSYNLDIYADPSIDGSGIKLASLDYFGKDPNKGEVVWLPVKNFFIRSICIWQSGIIKSVMSNQYDIFIFWGDAYRISTWLSAILAKAKGKKVVFWTHGVYGNEGRLKLFIRKLFYKIPDSFLLYGFHSKRLLEQLGFDNRRLFVINNSLDADVQNIIYKEGLGRNSSSHIKSRMGVDRLLIFVGRLTKIKKIEMLLLSLKHINEKAKLSTGLLLVGEGEEAGDLLSFCESLGITDKVVFYKSCYDQEVLCTLISSSDMCVSPGNIGLTAMQSLIFGTPVVTHGDMNFQMPECESVREGVSGALFEYNNQKSLVSAIERCFYYLDTGRISAESCRKVVLSEYTPRYQKNVFNNMLKFLDH